MSFLTSLSHLTFSNPWLLSGFIFLPLIWWFLRVTPPSPKQITFPAIMLLVGLANRNQTADKAPWWIILIRIFLISCLIIAFSHPVMRKNQHISGNGPVLLIIEDDWASAQNWITNKENIHNILQEIGQLNRPIFLGTNTITPQKKGRLLSGPHSKSAALKIINQLKPSPFSGNSKALLKELENKTWSEPPYIIWFNSGVFTRGNKGLSEKLPLIGKSHIVKAEDHKLPVYLILDKNSNAQPSGIEVTLTRPRVKSQKENDLLLSKRSYSLLISGRDGRLLGKQEVTFSKDETQITLPLHIPDTFISDIGAVTIEKQNHAASTYLLDERWRNAKIGILQPEGEEALPLLSEIYFLDKATEPLGAISIAPLHALMRMQMGVILLPDSQILSTIDRKQLLSWVQDGGVLIRFAGPNLAQQKTQHDPLLPVRIRQGGRAMDGMLQWDKPAKLSNFNKHGPLAGLKIPKDVIIKRQILAENGPDVFKGRWASLEDGTSLISGRRKNKGWLVLFHSTANAKWSNLALSGSFPALLERISSLAFSSLSQNPDAVTETKPSLAPYKTINGFGVIGDATQDVQALDLRRDTNTNVVSTLTWQNPPGLYGDKNYNKALNLSEALGDLTTFSIDRSQFTILNHTIEAIYNFKPVFLAAVFILLLLDQVLSLGLRGQLPLSKASNNIHFLILFSFVSMLVFGLAKTGEAQSIVSSPVTPPKTSLMTGTNMAFVVTGNPKVDKISEEGLSGLALILNQRTAIEAAEPRAVNLGKDELAFYPFLYWPITQNQQNLSQTAIEQVNTYLSFGGTILFDTQRKGSDERAKLDLRRLTQGLKIPDLVPVSTDHILTKTFYLLQEFPGRWQGGDFWVEPATQGTTDGVSRVIVGQNDWAGAWAMDSFGRPRYPVTPGGDTQREMAFRFGVNLMMYMLTGNYKKDQVHIPAILERLGQ